MDQGQKQKGISNIAPPSIKEALSLSFSICTGRSAIRSIADLVQLIILIQEQKKNKKDQSSQRIS